MLIVVAGKNNIAVNITQYLLDNCDERYQLGVVCNRTETGKDAWQKSLRAFAQKNHVREYELKEIYSVKDLLFLSLEFDRLLRPDKFLSNRLFNIHFSLLPKYRGMYTSALPILHGEHETGVTLHRIDSGIDTGEIIAQREIQINREDTARDLYLKYIYYGTELVKEYLEVLMNGTERSVPQNESEATYYSKDAIDYADIRIDLDRKAYEIQNQIRAFVFREYQLPKVCKSYIIDTRITQQRSAKGAGKILYENECAMIVSSQDYNIILYKDQFDELAECCKKGDISRIKEIGIADKSIFQRDGEGNNLLIIAAKNNHIEIVEYLLLCGVDIDEENYVGESALDYADKVYHDTGDSRMQELLCDLGAKRGKNKEMRNKRRRVHEFNNIEFIGGGAEYS